MAVGSESRSAVGSGVAPGPVKGAGLGARLRSAAVAHPRLVAWLVLAIGMVAVLLWAWRGQPLRLQERLVLAAATVGLAGLCAWIIHWEDGS